MVITKLYGGLGNQIFQYATGKSIAIQNNTQVLLDISFYGKQNLRQFELMQYKISASVATDEQIISVIGSNLLLRRLKKKFNVGNYIHEKLFGLFQQITPHKTQNIYLDGYWQSEKYFDSIREVLQEEFTPISNLGELSTVYMDDIKSSQSVSIHIRRGDYVANAHTNSVHGVCDLGYYGEAVAYINDKIINPKFFIFSDDIEWCKKNLDFIKNAIFVENTESAIEDLELMKQCKHNIIANSTFSWWAAWLNQNPSKMVISPRIWFDAMPNTHIAPAEWIRL